MHSQNTRNVCLHTYCRGIATGGLMRPCLPSPLLFPNQTRSNSFSFKHQECSFLQVFRPELSRFLPHLLQFLDNLRRPLIFSNYIGEVDHFTLDLLTLDLLTLDLHMIHMILLIGRVLCFYNQTNKYNLKIILIVRFSS